jgi:hypothetical protein
MKIVALTVLLAVMQAAPPVQRKAADTSDSNSQNVQGDTETHQTPPGQPPSVKYLDGAAAADKQPRPTPPNADKPNVIVVREPNSTSIWEKVYVVFTGLLVFVGAIGIGYAIKTLQAVEGQVSEMKAQRETMQGQLAAMQGQLTQMQSSGTQTDALIEQAKQQTKELHDAADIALAHAEAAVDSAKAARVSADIAATVAIPTLVVEKFEVGETGAANLEAFLQCPQISMTVKNCGHTPAFLKWWTIIFTAEDLPEIPQYNKSPAHGMLLEKIIVEPSKSYTLPKLFFPHRVELELKDVRAIIERQAMLNVYGFICYGDLFGNPLRRLKFCETALNLFDGPQPMIQWVDFGDPAYTGTDQFPFKKGQGIDAQPIRADAKAENSPKESNE